MTYTWLAINASDAFYVNGDIHARQGPSSFSVFKFLKVRWLFLSGDRPECLLFIWNDEFRTCWEQVQSNPPLSKLVRRLTKDEHWFSSNVTNIKC